MELAPFETQDAYIAYHTQRRQRACGERAGLSCCICSRLRRDRLLNESVIAQPSPAQHRTAPHELNPDPRVGLVGVDRLTTKGEECRTWFHLCVCAFFDLGHALGAPEVTSGDYGGGLTSGLSVGNGLRTFLETERLTPFL